MAAFLAEAQKAPDKGYFTFPIQPGRANYLSGSMGELRSSHFHAGLDIKTNGREGLEVYAAADGYISRIRASNSGYGNAIYIQHPNGYSSVYAHLMEFKEPFATFVRTGQYARESFEIELYPKAGEFPVKKGQVIALSGNTGSSGGPHLHFEVRNPNQRVIDPLTLGFTEIKDTTPPIVESFAIRSMDLISTHNGRVGRAEYPLQRTGNTYKPSVPITAKGKFGIEILAHDKLDGSANKNGVYSIEMKQNGQLIFRQVIDEVDFDRQREILVVYDYEESKKTGRRFNKLYVDRGNRLAYYAGSKNQGIVNLKEGENAELEIILSDSYGNRSQVMVNMAGGSLAQATGLSEKPGLSLSGAILKIVEEGKPKDASLFIKGTKYDLTPAYRNATASVFLWDLRFGIPDSLLVGGSKHTPPPFLTVVLADRTIKYRSGTLDVEFPAGAAFHDFAISGKAEGDKVLLGDDYVPFQKSFSVSFIPETRPQNTDKWAIYEQTAVDKFSWVGSKWEGQRVSFSTRNLGTYVLKEDNTPPVITPLTYSSELIAMRIEDDLSGIKSFRATLNGKWLLMKYESKKSLLWTDHPDPNLPFRGEFRLEVTDNVGNLQVFTTKID